MAARSATYPWQRLHAATCACAASGSGARPSCSTTNSTSLHCITNHSAGAGAGGPPRATTLKSFRRRFLMSRREAARTPRNCTHCSSIIVPRLRLCRLPFLPRLLAYFFLEQVPQACARLVQLRLRISHRASHDIRDLVVFVALDVV